MATAYTSTPAVSKRKSEHSFCAATSAVIRSGASGRNVSSGLLLRSPFPVHQFFHTNCVGRAHRRVALASGIYKAYGVGSVASVFLRTYLQRSGDTLCAKTSVLETRTCSRCLFFLTCFCDKLKGSSFSAVMVIHPHVTLCKVALLFIAGVMQGLFVPFSSLLVKSTSCRQVAINDVSDENKKENSYRVCV